MFIYDEYKNRDLICYKDKLLKVLNMDSVYVISFYLRILISYKLRIERIF